MRDLRDWALFFAAALLAVLLSDAVVRQRGGAATARLTADYAYFLIRGDNRRLYMVSRVEAESLWRYWARRDMGDLTRVP